MHLKKQTNIKDHIISINPVCSFIVAKVNYSANPKLKKFHAVIHSSLLCNIECEVKFDFFSLINL